MLYNKFAVYVGNVRFVFARRTKCARVMPFLKDCRT